jgi:hypothetical protein
MAKRKAICDDFGKVCTGCTTYKPFEMFSAQTRMWDGRQSRCKACYAEKAIQYRKYTPCVRCGAAKEYGVPKGAKLCLQCAKSCSECNKNVRHKQRTRCLVCILRSNRDCAARPESQIKNRITRIASKYKVSRDVACALSVIDKCQCCGKGFRTSRNRHVDHCHATGAVRGVVCFQCNAALGHLSDDCGKVTAVLGYLAKYKNGREDIEKAIHCLRLLLEIEYPPCK